MLCKYSPPVFICHSHLPPLWHHIKHKSERTINGLSITPDMQDPTVLFHLFHFSSITRIHPSPPLNLIHCSLIYCPQRSLTMPLKVGFMRLQFHSGGGAGRVNPIRLSSHGDTLTWQKWWLLWSRVVCRRESDNVRERGRNIEINWGNSEQNRPSWVLRVYFHLHITWIF